MRAALLGSKQAKPIGRARRSLGLLSLCLFVVTATACRSSNSSEKPRGLVVVNATATGIVRRVLASEGAAVNENAVILEIAEQPDLPAAQQPQTDDSQARAQAANAVAQREIQADEAEVQRAAVEVQRIQSLVASGAAAQAQLDAARAQYQQAQEKLQLAKDKAQSAQRNLIAQQGRAVSQSPPKPSEQIISVRVPSSGIVRVISVRAGQRVTEGQPIATIASDK
jgi:multidrug efflux pump subunit AcrA (membrane-fusion protein)